LAARVVLLRLLRLLFVGKKKERRARKRMRESIEPTRSWHIKAGALSFDFPIFRICFDDHEQKRKAKIHFAPAIKSHPSFLLSPFLLFSFSPFRLFAFYRG